MKNAFVTPDWIVREFERQSAGRGDTITVRLPQRYLVTDAFTMPMAPLVDQVGPVSTPLVSGKVAVACVALAAMASPRKFTRRGLLGLVWKR